MSQVIKVQFARDIDLRELIDLWGDRGVVRPVSHDTAEMTSTTSGDIVVVDLKRGSRVMNVQGGVSDDAWSWIEQLRERFGGIVSGEHTEAVTSGSLSFRDIAPHWRVVGAILAIVLLPLTLILGLVYAGVQITRFAMKARRL